MARRARPRNARQLGAALAASAAHLAVFWLMIAGVLEEPVPFADGAMTLSIVAGSAPGEPASSPPAAAQAPDAPELPTETPPESTPQQPPEPAPADDIPPVPPAAPAPPPTPPDAVLEAVRRIVGADSGAAVEQAAPTLADVGAAPAGGGLKCEAGGAVLDEILHDPDALRALAALPRTSLSVAGAIQLWDGRAWVDETTVGGVGATLPVRKAVARALENSPPECLQMPFAGPRFLIVPLVDQTPVIVVVGSGEWTWAQALTQSGLTLQSPLPPSGFAPF